jgi:hypothetical protein
MHFANSGRGRETLRHHRNAGQPRSELTSHVAKLPLLIDGRKKLARMSDGYPPLTFEGEDRFDHWV